jgi:hypothetical protein
MALGVGAIALPQKALNELELIDKNLVFFLIVIDSSRALCAFDVIQPIESDRVVGGGRNEKDKGPDGGPTTIRSLQPLQKAIGCAAVQEGLGCCVLELAAEPVGLVEDHEDPPTPKPFAPLAPGMQEGPMSGQSNAAPRKLGAVYRVPSRIKCAADEFPA